VGNPGEDVTGPFLPVADGIRLTMSAPEADVLRVIPELLQTVEGDDPAAGRLNVAPYPDDAEASDEYRRLMADEMEQSRAADRSAFALTVDQAPQGVTLSEGEAEAWLRVLGEARLVLAARLGIRTDGWEAELSNGEPAVALLHYLGWLQQSLTETLEEQIL